MTVVYPLTVVRGRAADRVRTWTHGQTLARERYRVVVASDGADPGQDREAQGLLGPSDTFLRVPGGVDAELWNAGAAHAGTPWLIFTEGHCLADTDCLAALARWIATDPGEGVGNFVIGNAADHPLARLSRRWFAAVHARWQAPDEWPRVHRSGFAMRAGAFAAVGAFEPSYGQFAPSLLSARLHARGIGVGSVPGALVWHVDDERIRHHHADTADHARGELAARDAGARRALRGDRVSTPVSRPPLGKVVIVNTTDEGGGAERMSLAALDGFAALGTETWLLVGQKRTDHPRVIPLHLSPFFDYRPYQSSRRRIVVERCRRLERRRRRSGC